MSLEGLFLNDGNVQCSPTTIECYVLMKLVAESPNLYLKYHFVLETPMFGRRRVFKPLPFLGGPRFRNVFD
jgi:hypothetical protein